MPQCVKIDLGGAVTHPIKKVGIYARVSTGSQSVGMQLRDLRNYAQARDFVIANEFIDDGVSGTKDSRPALNKLMDSARKGHYAAVLVWRFDRWARSTKHLIETLLEFKTLGIQFLSYQENLDTGTPMGQAMFTIIAALGQLERDIIVQRVHSGLENAKAKGIRLGRPRKPPNENILALRREGKSIRQIAKILRIPKSTVGDTLSGKSVSDFKSAACATVRQKR